MKSKDQDFNFRFIVTGLWLPFILGIIKVFITSGSSPFFAKIFMGFILGFSYIPFFLPIGIFLIGFLTPYLIKLIKNHIEFRKFSEKYDFENYKKVKKAS